VQGTNANGRVGPNLTHIASRQYIAAGSLPNTHENLKQWVTDSQAFKPGTRMPQNTYSEDDLNALVSYLESLK
jgi:cytochrome c oxidase subunit II